MHPKEGLVLPGSPFNLDLREAFMNGHFFKVQSKGHGADANSSPWQDGNREL